MNWMFKQPRIWIGIGLIVLAQLGCSFTPKPVVTTSEPQDTPSVVPSPTATDASSRYLYDLDFEPPLFAPGPFVYPNELGGNVAIWFGEIEIAPCPPRMGSQCLLFQLDPTLEDPYDQILISIPPEPAFSKYFLSFDMLFENMDEDHEVVVLFDAPTVNNAYYGGIEANGNLVSHMIEFDLSSMQMKIFLEVNPGEYLPVFQQPITSEGILESIRFNLGPKSLNIPKNPGILVYLDNIKIWGEE